MAQGLKPSAAASTTVSAGSDSVATSRLPISGRRTASGSGGACGCAGPGLPGAAPASAGSAVSPRIRSSISSGQGPARHAAIAARMGASDPPSRKPVKTRGPTRMVGTAGGRPCRSTSVTKSRCAAGSFSTSCRRSRRPGSSAASRSRKAIARWQCGQPMLQKTWMVTTRGASAIAGRGAASSSARASSASASGGAPMPCPGQPIPAAHGFVIAHVSARSWPARP